MEKRTRKEIVGLGEISYVQNTSERDDVAKGVQVYESGEFRSRQKRKVFVYQDESGKITVYNQLIRWVDHYYIGLYTDIHTFIYSDCEIMDPINIRSTYYYKVKDSDITWVKSLIKPENMKPPKRYEKILPYLGKINCEGWSSPHSYTSGKIVYDTFSHKIHIDRDSKTEGIVVYHTYKLFPFFVTQIEKYTKCEVNRMLLYKIGLL